MSLLSKGEPQLRINRNIVECKVRIVYRKANSHIVLIETLWNVKTETLPEQTRIVAVLIETLWNVKSGIRAVITSSAVSINRNIVECKENFPLQYLLQIPWY